MQTHRDISRIVDSDREVLPLLYRHQCRHGIEGSRWRQGLQVRGKRNLHGGGPWDDFSIMALPVP
jgi:hypothetical protein